MMRKNKYILSEALGVPDNLYETSLKVYEELLLNAKKITKNKLDIEDSIEFDVYDNFNISDLKFTHLILRFEIKEDEDFSEPTFSKFYTRQELQLSKDYRIENVYSSKVLVGLLILVPKNYNYKSLEDFIKSKRKLVVGSLNHELMHVYESYKKKYENPEERVLYSGIQGKNFGVFSVNEFLHFLYFTTNIENVVRNSEVSAAIIEDKISQKDFLKFLYNDNTFLKLKKISKFNYEDLKSNLINEIDYIDRFFKHFNVDTTGLTTEDKVDKLLHLVFMNIRRWMVEEYHEMLTESFIEKLVGFGKEKEKIFDKFVNRQNRFKHHDEFYKFYEKLFKEVSNKMIRKIAKLYAIIK